MSAPAEGSRRGGRKLVGTAVGGLIAAALAVAAAEQAYAAFTDQRSTLVTRMMRAPVANAGDQAKARRILKRDPYDTAVLSALAVSLEKAGDLAGAGAMMSIAGAQSWRNIPTDIWLLQKNLDAGDFTGAMRRADAVLRVEPALSRDLFPVLSAVAADPRGSGALANRLAMDPPWRSLLINELVKSNPNAAYQVISKLQATSAPPLEHEVSWYVERLMNAERYEEAYLVFLLHLAPSKLRNLDMLYNGAFENISGIAPFAWQAETGNGASSAIEMAPGRPSNPAMHLMYSGSLQSLLVSQKAVLPPGDYLLEGETYSDNPMTSDRARWRLICLNTNETLLDYAPGSTTSWKKFSTPFSVPSNCNAQVVQLSASGSERQTSLDVWIDNLVVRRAS